MTKNHSTSIQRCFAPFVLASLVAGSPFAQSSGSDQKDRVRRAVMERRDQMRSGDIVLANAKITVRLKNGNKMTGVVKGEQFVERFDALDFVPANLQSPEAGLRIWYYDSTNSYVFLRYAEISEYKIKSRLSDVQVREMEQKALLEREEAERRRRESLARAEKAAQTDAEGGEAGDAKAGEKTDKTEKSDKSGAKASATTALTADQARALKVVEEFPPADGWSEAKAKEIEKRKVVVGTYPSPKEKRFLEVLEQWKKGVELKKQQDAEKASTPGQ